MKQLSLNLGSNRICSICGATEKVIAHHLSYDPEIIIFLCRWHHSLVHAYARIKSEKRVFVNEWVERYGHLWVEGAHKRSLRRKEKQKEYKRSSYWRHPQSDNKKRIDRDKKNHEGAHQREKRYRKKIMNDPILHQRFRERKNREQRKRRKSQDA